MTVAQNPDAYAQGEAPSRARPLHAFVAWLVAMLDYITRFVRELEVGTVNVWDVPGYRIEMSPFGGIKDSGLGYKEGVIEAMKSFTNVKTYSLPWG